MKVASRPEWLRFCFLPKRESLRLEPIPEWEAAFIDFFLIFPLTRLPILIWCFWKLWKLLEDGDGVWLVGCLFGRPGVCRYW